MWEIAHGCIQNNVPPALISCGASLLLPKYQAGGCAKLAKYSFEKGAAATMCAAHRQVSGVGRLATGFVFIRGGDKERAARVFI